MSCGFVVGGSEPLFDSCNLNSFSKSSLSEAGMGDDKPQIVHSWAVRKGMVCQLD